jgi:hypothetical protein
MKIIMKSILEEGEKEFHNEVELAVELPYGEEPTVDDMKNLFFSFLQAQTYHTEGYVFGGKEEIFEELKKEFEG